MVDANDHRNVTMILRCSKGWHRELHGDIEYGRGFGRMCIWELDLHRIVWYSMVFGMEHYLTVYTVPSLIN